MGRDHTIYALETGYVKFYKDPSRHPDRRYIGVAFSKEDKLPSPKNAPSKRRLGMIAVPRREDDVEIAIETALESGQSLEEPMKVKLVASSTSAATLRPGYMYRESNWEIGRAAEKAGIRVKEWKRKDRWTAWKKKLLKIQRIAQMKELKNRRKSKAKAGKKVARIA
jgi:large subunit ribosomal protein L27